MHELTKMAREILIENGYTAVLCSEDEVYYSTERGVKPLIGFLDSGKSFSGFCAADKTIGLGAAHIYILLRVRSVFATVISISARALLESAGIAVSFESEVPYIINRKGDGPCPIERAVNGISDSQKALSAIRETLEELKKM